MLRYDDIDRFNETTQGESSNERFKKRHKFDNIPEGSLNSDHCCGVRDHLLNGIQLLADQLTRVNAVFEDLL